MVVVAIMILVMAIMMAISDLPIDRVMKGIVDVVVAVVVVWRLLSVRISGAMSFSKCVWTTTVERGATLPTLQLTIQFDWRYSIRSVSYGSLEDSLLR